MFCTWFGEIGSCCSFTVLHGPPWVLLSYVLQTILELPVPYVSEVIWKSCVYRARGRRHGRTREHETSPKAHRDIRYKVDVSLLPTSNLMKGNFHQECVRPVTPSAGQSCRADRIDLEEEPNCSRWPRRVGMDTRRASGHFGHPPIASGDSRREEPPGGRRARPPAQRKNVKGEAHGRKEEREERETL